MSDKPPKPAVRIAWRARLTRPLLAARTWLLGNRLRGIVAIGILVALLTGAPLVLVVGGRAWRHREKPAERPTLAMALVALDHQGYSEARQIVARLDRSQMPGPELGGPDYVEAVVAADEANELWGAERKNYYLLATRHLEVARERKFERALEPAGLLLLGKCLLASGRVAESRPILEQALEALPEQATEIHLLLARAYHRPPDRDLAQALLHDRAYLADPDLTASQRESGQVREAQLLWYAHEYEQCRAVLVRIPKDAYLRPEVDLLYGRLALLKTRELKAELKEGSSPEERAAVKQQYEAAIKILRTAQDDPLNDRAIRRSMYLIGVCLLEMGDSRAALTQFERTRDVYRDTSEGIAAGLQEADLLLAARREDDALAAYRRTLSSISEERPFVNRWIASAKSRARVMSAYQHFIDASDYERAISLTERLAPLFPPAQAVRLTGETYRTWARNLRQSADAMPEPQASQTRAQARELYRQAGEVFGRLAALDFTNRNYADDVWLSAESYLAGHQFTQAVGALEEYLKYELRRRRPLALVSMGEALVALGRLDDALVALAECIEFYPNDAACFQARLWAARAHAEKGESAEAESLLRENLNGELLTPDSKEWRDSLFALGKLLAAGGRHVEAIERLEEAVSRYPDSLQAIEARHLIAEACQQAAKVPQEKMATDTVETARLAHLKEAQQYLEMAITYYEQTQEVLNRRQEQTELSPLEKALLRNSYFSIGAALFELGRYEEAIKAYSAATNRYQHDPEVLEAFAQIAACYRRLNKPREARGAVQQALVVLERIKPEAPFNQASLYTRREWKDLLEWMSKL